jgi:predicted HTH domain antitoxin
LIMILELPDERLPADSSPEMLRLELACALYARGKLGKIGAAELAGVSLSAIMGALAERGVETYTLDMLERDEANLDRVFSR